jgi:hypothetical protein
MRIEPEYKLEDMKVGSHKRAHFLVCLLTLGMVPIEYHVASSRLAYPLNGKAVSAVVKRYEVGRARDYCVENLLKMPKESRPDYMFFFGDDMIPESDALIKLYAEMATGKWDVLTGLYYLKMNDPVPLTWREGTVGYLYPGVHYKVGEVIDVDITGMDFTLISTEFLEKMQKEIDPPYFQTGPSKLPYPSYYEENTIVTYTEDVYFLYKVRQCGGRIGVHTGIKVGHYDINTGMIF